MKNLLLTLFLISYCASVPAGFLSGQSSVAITIDDVPNTGKTRAEHYQSKLLKELDAIQIPVTIFVTEGLIMSGENPQKNSSLINRWMNRDNTTIGYHSSQHSQYSAVGLDSFKLDVERGEARVHALAAEAGKTVDYFRLPFNDLGKDSLQHVLIGQYLTAKNYRIAPFTVESEDWMFNSIYEYYLDKKDSVKARETAADYIKKTLEYFNFFDSLALIKYGRPVNQIYLCHDSKLNADYLPELIRQLKKENYRFISFSEALKDPVYQQKDMYNKKWGISWLYRWMKSQDEISAWMKKEPADDTYKLYNELILKPKNN